MAFNFSTLDVAESHRRDYWTSAVCSRLIPATATYETSAAFAGSLDGHRLGSLTVCRMSSLRHVFRRTEQDLRQSPDEDIVAVLVQQGSATMTQNGREVVVGAGDIVLYDAARPFVHDLSPESLLLVRLKREQISSRLRGVEAMMAVRIDGRRSMGRVLSAMMEEAYLAREGLTDSATAHLSSALLDTLAATLETQLGTSTAAESTRYDALFRKAADYIRLRLDDCALDGEDIADALHVSSRTLTRVCTRQGTSVARLIGSLRLQASFGLLSERRVRQVSDAAYQCGFGDLSHFCRAFKREFGRTPGEVLQARAA